MLPRIALLLAVFVWAQVPAPPDPNGPDAGTPDPNRPAAKGHALPADTGPPPPPPLVPRELDLPFERIGLPVLSADGRTVAFTALDEDDWQQIYTTPVQGGPPRAITSGAHNNDSPRFSPDGSRIAFVSDRSGSADIWIAPASGGAAVQVTEGPADDLHPAWSPDGRRLVFASTRTGLMLLHTIDLETKKVTPITAGPGPDRRPAWSRDGKWIAYESLVRGRARIQVVPAAGGEPRTLSVTSEPEIAPWWSDDGRVRAIGRNHGNMVMLDYGLDAKDPLSGFLPVPLDAGLPAVSAAGDRIVYLAPGGTGVGLIDFTKGGTGLTVAEGGAVNRHPTWTPDGRRLIFVSDRDGRHDLFMVGLASGMVSRLTNSIEREEDPHCSRAGGDIAFSVRTGAGSAIWILEPETGRTIKVTASEGRNQEPAWSPDGKEIAFASDREGSLDIWIVRVGDGATRRLTTLASDETHPTWSPDGTWIAFAADSGSGSEIHKVPVTGGDPVRLSSSERGAEAFHPDWPLSDTWIAYTNASPEGSDIYLVPSGGGRPFPYHRPKQSRESHPAWSPDATNLAYDWSVPDRLLVLEMNGR